MRTVRSFAALGFLLAWAVFLSSCQTGGLTVSAYDPAAHQNAIVLRNEAVALMAKAGEPFAQHKAEVELLNAKVEAAYQVAASTPRNELVAREWQVLKDPERDLYGGFIKRWQTSGALRTVFREEASAQVTEGFDLIICLEAAKKSGGQCATGGA